ncbi:unnamed protein product [Prunus armeniaca]
MVLVVEQEESSIKLLKAASKLSKDKFVTSRARGYASVKKEFDISFCCDQVSSKGVSSAKRTLVHAAPSSCARVKHLMGADS